MGAVEGVPDVIVPCDHRGPLKRHLDCGCGGPRNSYLCHNTALAQQECVLTPLMPKAVRKFGSIQACGECVQRVWKGVPCPAERKPEPAAIPESSVFPASRLVFDIETPEFGYDPSLCRHNSKTWLAWRDDERTLRIAQVDAAWKIGESREVYVPPIREAMDGKAWVKLQSLEQLTLSFTGRNSSRDACIVVPLTAAGESSGYTPIYFPQGNGRETNWTLFGDGYASTGLNPHGTVKITGGTATDLRRERWNCSWAWGEMTNGSPPVLRDGRWVTWFSSGAYLGAVEFEDRPPFRVVRCVGRPMYAKAEGTKVGGAVYNHGRWTLSVETGGRIRFVQILDADLERELVTL